MKRTVVYSAVFLGLNLAFVPLISLYGLRVCPVLHMGGFLGGCSYSGAFIACVLGVNFLLLRILSGKVKGRAGKIALENPLLAYSGAYIAATVLALSVLTVFFRMNHIMMFSRAPEVLALASLLLGITQAYGMNWALSGRDRRGPSGTLRARWLAHVVRVSLPLAAALAVLAHFLLRQSGALNRGHIAPSRGVDGLIADSVLLIGFLLVWLAATYLFHFLEEKSHADIVQAHIEELNGLNFSYRSDPGAAWGLWAEIMAQLNGMAGALAERYSLFNTFSKFVGREVADRAAKSEISGTSGEERDLTILMSDIRGFTALSEKLGPAAVSSMLNAYFAAMLEELTGHGLAADKFVGDGILAYVRPKDGADAAACNAAAVDCSLAMFRRLEELNAGFLASGLPALAIGVGLCRGNVSLGVIGSAEKLQYTVIGDAVNRAARFEGLCRETGARLVISRAFRETLDGPRRSLFVPLGGRKIKGLTDIVEVFGNNAAGK